MLTVAVVVGTVVVAAVVADPVGVLVMLSVAVAVGPPRSYFVAGDGSTQGRQAETG